MADDLRLVMQRADLEGIPEYPMPDGFSFRWYGPGDDAAWYAVQRVAERYATITPQSFEQFFGRDPAILSQRVGFLQDDNTETIVGTASAWWGDDAGHDTWGRLHWIAVVPDYQGRGLSKPMLAAACRRLAELGHEATLLVTSALRIPALNLYRVFGFEPLVESKASWDLWRSVSDQLKRGLGPSFPEAFGDRERS